MKYLETGGFSRIYWDNLLTDRLKKRIDELCQIAGASGNGKIVSELYYFRLLLHHLELCDGGNTEAVVYNSPTVSDFGNGENFYGE